MPNPIGHILFAGDVAEGASVEARGIVCGAPDAYATGALGPDYLFLLRELKLADKRYGNRMHSERCIDTMNAVARNASTITEKAYALGFATHYVFDSALHPYVFREAVGEVSRRLNPELKPFTHSVIESAIDGEMLSTHGGKFSYAPNRKTLKAIASFASEAFDPLYGEKVSAKRVEFAFRLARFVMKLCLNASGKTKKRIVALENAFFGGTRRFSSLLQPAYGNGSEDFLNEERRPFPAARDGEETSDSTVRELIAAAKERAKAFLDKMLLAFGNEYRFTLRDMPLSYEGQKL